MSESPDLPEPQTARELVECALKARQRAHAPYSGFMVGAAVATTRRQMFCGANVENASYGLTCCAERVAIFNAVANGGGELTAIAVASESGARPCGACLQVMREFAPGLVIYLAAADGTFTTHRLRDFLPDSFGPEDLDAAS